MLHNVGALIVSAHEEGERQWTIFYKHLTFGVSRQAITYTIQCWRKTGSTNDRLRSVRPQNGPRTSGNTNKWICRSPSLQASVCTGLQGVSPKRGEGKCIHQRFAKKEQQLNSQNDRVYAPSIQNVLSTSATLPRVEWCAQLCPSEPCFLSQTSL